MAVTMGTLTPPMTVAVTLVILLATAALMWLVARAAPFAADRLIRFLVEVHVARYAKAAVADPALPDADAYRRYFLSEVDPRRYGHNYLYQERIRRQLPEEWRW